MKKELKKGRVVEKNMYLNAFVKQNKHTHTRDCKGQTEVYL